MGACPHNCQKELVFFRSGCSRGSGCFFIAVYGVPYQQCATCSAADFPKSSGAISETCRFIGGQRPPCSRPTAGKSRNAARAPTQLTNLAAGFIRPLSSRAVEPAQTDDRTHIGGQRPPCSRPTAGKSRNAARALSQPTDLALVASSRAVEFVQTDDRKAPRGSIPGRPQPVEPAQAEARSEPAPTSAGF